MSETNRRMIFLTEDDVPGAKLKQLPSKCTISSGAEALGRVPQREEERTKGRAGREG